MIFLLMFLGIFLTVMCHDYSVANQFWLISQQSMASVYWVDCLYNFGLSFAPVAQLEGRGVGEAVALHLLAGRPDMDPLPAAIDTTGRLQEWRG